MVPFPDEDMVLRHIFLRERTTDQPAQSGCQNVRPRVVLYLEKRHTWKSMMVLSLKNTKSNILNIVRSIH